MYLRKLAQSGKTIFSLEDLGKIWEIEDEDYLKLVASRLFNRGEIIRVSRGIYALKESCNLYELANKLRKPSYVSLETILQEEGIIFQDYGKTIFSISNNTLTKKANGYDFEYYKIKDEALFNSLGVEMSEKASKAIPERAICDKLYLSSRYYFDNLRNINKEKLLEISKIYGNKRLEREVSALVKNN
jgi:predicted transcriptional regulator of viral defense system